MELEGVAAADEVSALRGQLKDAQRQAWQAQDALRQVRPLCLTCTVLNLLNNMFSNPAAQMSHTCKNHKTNRTAKLGR